MKHFLPRYHFTTVMWLFPPWYHFTTVMEHLYLDRILLPWWNIFYIDISLVQKYWGEGGGPPRAPPLDSPLFMLFYCCDVTFCTLISLHVHRDGTLSTLIMISLPWCTRPFGCLAEHFSGFSYCFCSTVIRICLYCQDVLRLFTYRYFVFFLFFYFEIVFLAYENKSTDRSRRSVGLAKRESRLVCSRAPRSLLPGVLVDFWRDKRQKSVYRLRGSFF